MEAGGCTAPKVVEAVYRSNNGIIKLAEQARNMTTVNSNKDKVNFSLYRNTKQWHITIH